MAHGALADVYHDAVIQKRRHNAAGHDACQTHQIRRQRAEIVRPGIQHRYNIVIHQRLRERRAYNRADCVYQNAKDNKCEQKFIIMQHVPDDALEYGHRTLLQTFLFHDMLSSSHAGWSKSPPPLTWDS